LSAGSINKVERSSTGASIVDFVVNLIGLAGYSADLKGNIEESTSWAGLASSSNQIIALDTDTLLIH
jgi:hypothetical protein